MICFFQLSFFSNSIPKYLKEWVFSNKEQFFSNCIEHCQIWTSGWWEGGISVLVILDTFLPGNSCLRIMVFSWLGCAVAPSSKHNSLRHDWISLLYKNCKQSKQALQNYSTSKIGWLTLTLFQLGGHFKNYRIYRRLCLERLIVFERESQQTKAGKTLLHK